VAFGANTDADVEMLKMGGSIGAYATDNATPKIPFWLMVFKNLRLYCLGSDDFPEANVAATRDLNAHFRLDCGDSKLGGKSPCQKLHARMNSWNIRCGGDALLSRSSFLADGMGREPV
jgi:hypothetical protein